MKPGLIDRAAGETLFEYVQSPIPNDQWIVELSNWFSVGLAGIQQSALEYAMGPQYLGESGVLERIPANDSLGQQLCRSQLIRNSEQVQSFSMLGIVLILALGGLILIVSVTMEPLVGGLQRRYGVGEHRQKQWTTDEKLQLIATREDRSYVMKDASLMGGANSLRHNSMDTGQAPEIKDSSRVAILELEFEHAREDVA